ncbi:MAG TPA: hypothetical protein VHB49_12990 [Bradyrhizobium sp.]|nr:hypothetical protein [Bradyrhizobium sp.]
MKSGKKKSGFQLEPPPERFLFVRVTVSSEGSRQVLVILAGELSTGISAIAFVGAIVLSVD